MKSAPQKADAGSKKVVCHLTTVHQPFDGRIFNKECLSLVQAGYEVHLVAAAAEDSVVQGVHIHALRRPASRLLRMLTMPEQAYRKVLSLRPRPSICHFHDPELLPVGMRLRMQGFQVVYDVHENVSGTILHKAYLPKPLRAPMAGAYRMAELLMTSGMATVHVLESIARRYRQPRAVVRNLPRLGLIPEGVERRPDGSRPRIVYVGGVSVIRGAMTMIDLAKGLKRRGRDFELRIVGSCDEPLAATMRAAIAEAGLGGQVLLVGQVSLEQSQREIAQSDLGLCLLHPVPNYLNSLAIKIFEYMRFGLPVVASNFECWREFIVGAGSGLQVDPMNAEQVADEVSALLADPQRMKQMGARGQDLVENVYCWEREQESLLEFYEKLLARRGLHPQANSRPYGQAWVWHEICDTVCTPKQTAAHTGRLGCGTKSVTLHASLRQTATTANGNDV